MHNYHLNPFHRIPTRTWAGVFLLIVTFLILAFPLVDDPDFGWHLKSGQLYAQTRQIPAHDIFSYTMNNYLWVNHEYGADTFYYFLYRLGGDTTILLSFFFLAIGVLTFLVVFPRTFPHALQTDERLFAGLIALLVSRAFFGIRSQVFDWLGFLLVILIWNHYKKTSSRQTLLWCIPLFFLWANIHGGFFIGLLLLSFLFFFDIIDRIKSGTLLQWFRREKYHLLSVFGILLMGGIATLINPYGIHLYQDIIRTLGNHTMLTTIKEWQPSVVSSALILPFVIYVFSLIFLLMIRKQDKPLAIRHAFLILLFLFLALSSIRFIPFFLFISLPILAYAYSENELFLPILLLLLFPGFFISVVYGNAEHTQNIAAIAASSSSPISLSARIKDRFYAQAPTGALAYLRAHPMKGNMFNDYDWGGTLIWSFPEYKVFIDGRMPYWQLGDRNILEDYLTIERVSQGWDKKINEYGIDWFIIRKSTPLAAVLGTLPAVWEKQYDDEFAVIFVRKKQL